MNFSAVDAHKRNGQQQEPGAGSRALGARTRARKWGRRTKDQGPRTKDPEQLHRNLLFVPALTKSG